MTRKVNAVPAMLCGERVSILEYKLAGRANNLKSQLLSVLATTGPHLKRIRPVRLVRHHDEDVDSTKSIGTS